MTGKYSLKDILGPTLMTSAIMGVSMAAIAAGRSSVRGDVFVWGGIGGLVGLYIGVAWVTPEIFKAIDPDVKLMAYELRSGSVKQEETKDMTINLGDSEGVYLKDVAIERWVEAARRIVEAEYKFSVGVLGRPLHDEIRTKIETKDCLCSVNPNNTLTLTQQGRSLFSALYPDDKHLPPTTVNDVPIFVRKWLK